jgi:hypothetical protein
VEEARIAGTAQATTAATTNNTVALKKNQRIARVYCGPPSDQSRGVEFKQDAGDQSRADADCSGAEHQSEHVLLLSPQSDANAEFIRPLRDAVGDHAVQAATSKPEGE